MTSAPMRIMPLSSRLRSISSPTLGISRVISSLPSLVSRASTSNSSMCIEVKISSFISFSLTRIESSKLYPPHGMKATSTLRSKSKFTHFRGRTVGDDIARCHRSPGCNNRTLIDAGVLVGAVVFDQVVNIDIRVDAVRRVITLDNNAVGIHALSPSRSRRATTATPESRAATALHAGADQRGLRVSTAARPDAAYWSP